MRTTIALDDAVLRAYKRRAADRGTTFAREVEETLRAALLRDQTPEPPFVLITAAGGGGLRPGVEINSNVALLDLLDGDAAVRTW